MATGKITKRSVDATVAGFLWDDELRGFGLKVTPAGARSYVVQYRMGGRETHARRYTIGTHGSPWTPASAREEAERLLLLVKRGIDPREQEREQRRQAVDLAFRQYAARFLDRYIRAEWPASHDFAESILRLHVIPVLGNKPMPSINRSDIAGLLDRVPPQKVALRRNIYAVVRRLFRWAVSRGDIDRSPLEGFETPAAAASRDRVLSDKELALVWQASGQIEYPFGPMFRLLVVTGQRREEVAALEWHELDRTTCTWMLPAARSKNGRAHLVPLNALAVAVLDGVAKNKNWPSQGFVFTTTGETPVSGYSRAKRRLDAKIADAANTNSEDPARDGEAITIAPWRVHDLRRTLATGFQRLGVRFEVTEAVLNHVSGARSGVAGVYQRHDWALEKRAALEAWARHIEGFRSAGGRSSNVIALNVSQA